jgi:hypothetical protein
MQQTNPQPKRGESEFQRRVMRSCDKCQFFSDQQARIARGKLKALEAVCLNEDSIHSGKWKREQESCYRFVAGEPIDLPAEDAA